VRHPDSTKPAHEVSAEPVSGSEFLPGSKLSSNTPNASEAQAADDRGEDDETFFRRHPNVNARTRLPFPNEFPAGLIEQGRGLTAFVHVLIIRNSDGSPGTRARGIFYGDGGTA
jgi:hypothetical protein